ncbi:MAG TPA: hypothetical protein VMY34_02410 [Acidimicrobiales bacterium]|nr:hypothetical protein [Acidimicrobiales bacterium]
MTTHDTIIARLNDLGSNPVDPATASQHLTTLATAATPAEPSRWWTKARVAAAFAAGILIGGTGLASAGALPDVVQDKVANVAAKVGLDLPQGTARYAGAECGLDADGQPIEWRNHGQYLKSLPADQREAASSSKCGKPLSSINGDTSDAGDEDGPNACKGAGKGRGNGHASSKAAQKANVKAKEHAGALDGSEPTEKPGKPDCVDELNSGGVAGTSDEVDDDAAPGDDEDEISDDETAGRPASPGQSDDHAARDDHGRSLDDDAPGDDEGSPSADDDDLGSGPSDDAGNPYDDADPGD